MRIVGVLSYLDELVAVVAAVSSYVVHRDESLLADDLTAIGLGLAKQFTHGDPLRHVDEEQLRQALVQVIDALEPLFG